MTRLKQLLLTAALFLCPLSAFSQQGGQFGQGQGTTRRFISAAAAPASCVPGDVYFDTVLMQAFLCVSTGVFEVFDTAGGTPPAGASGDIQFNNAGAFGGIGASDWNGTRLDLNNAGTGSCQGFLCVRGEGEGTIAGFPSLVHLEQRSSLVDWLFAWTNTAAPAGSYITGFIDNSSGGLALLQSDGTTGSSSWTMIPSQWSWAAADGTNSYVGGLNVTANVFKIQPRLAIGGPVGNRNVDGDFALSAGWGTIATITTGGQGAESVMKFTVTSAGTGQASGPTITYTYTNGTLDFGVGTPVFSCQQVGGTGIVADLTLNTGVSGATSVVWKWNATPTAAATYIFNCVGIAIGATAL